MAKVVKIALAGEGGQGVQSIAEILAEAANEQGKQALYIPNFGVEQRRLAYQSPMCKFRMAQLVHRNSKKPTS